MLWWFFMTQCVTEDTHTCMKLSITDLHRPCLGCRCLCKWWRDPSLACSTDIPVTWWRARVHVLVCTCVKVCERKYYYAWQNTNKNTQRIYSYTQCGDGEWARQENGIQWEIYSERVTSACTMKWYFTSLAGLSIKLAILLLVLLAARLKIQKLYTQLFSKSKLMNCIIKILF